SAVLSSPAHSRWCGHSCPSSVEKASKKTRFGGDPGAILRRLGATLGRLWGDSGGALGALFSPIPSAPQFQPPAMPQLAAPAPPLPHPRTPLRPYGTIRATHPPYFLRFPIPVYSYSTFPFLSLIDCTHRCVSLSIHCVTDRVTMPSLSSLRMLIICSFSS